MNRYVQEYLIKQFTKEGVIKNGHFILKSGKHSDTYINKDAIYANKILLSETMNYFKDNLFKMMMYFDKIDFFVGPPMAGIVIASYLTALLKNDKGPIGIVYPEKLGEEFIFRRGYDKAIFQKKVFLVEDIITTGNSIDKLISAVEYCGGNIVGLCSIWERNDLTNKYITKFPYSSLIKKEIKAFSSEECPQCKIGIPVQNPKG